MFRRAPTLLALMLTLLFAVPAQANVIVNGSFETGPPPSDAVMLTAGSTAIPGWTVTHTNLDYCGSRWTAFEGSRSLGLNGTNSGGIAQTFTTQIHAQYTVRFWMAGDPATTPVIKQMRVTAAGQSADYEADITGMWAWDPGWNWHLFTFNATAATTTLEFFSLQSGDSGPALDSVDVELNSTVDVPPKPPHGFAFTLAPAAPTPLRDASRISFTLPAAARARLSVVDIRGREVAVLADGALDSGPHELSWDGVTRGGRVEPGLYFLVLRSAAEQRVQRLVVLR
jgi:choice-of-anchor C domain-containing protein